jgi:ribose transport system substrate-binding protein
MRQIPPPDSSPEYQVTSVVRACRIVTAFAEPDEVLELPAITVRTGLHRATVFRLLQTLVATKFLERVGECGYRSCCRLGHTATFRIGYAEQSLVVPFIRTVTASIRGAAAMAGVELLVWNNRASRRTALRNADLMIREGVDLVIEFQVIADIADQISSRFSAAGIPLIAVDNPHPGATYFGADNYNAGHLAGSYLARWVARHWGGEADELVLIGAAFGGPILEMRLQGVVDGLTSGMPAALDMVRTHLDSKGAFSLALEAVRRYLRTTRARRVLLAAVNDPSALAAVEACREHGRERDCAVVGHDGTAEGRQELRRPHTCLVGTVAYFPETYGERLIPLALSILHKRAVMPAVYTHHVLLTRDNVDRVYSNDLVVGRLA